MNTKQSFKMALKSLAGSKMRAFLTMLGIIIGVASVIVLVSLMNGLTKDLTSSFEKMGTNTLTVTITGRGGNRSFSVDDMEELVAENPEHLDQYSPLVTVSATVKNGTESLTSTVRGVSEAYQSMQSVELQSGRFLQYIDVDRRQKVCVVGTYQMEELFDGVDPVGQTLKVNGSNYTIIGLLEESDDSSEGSDDDIIYVPYTTATRMSSGTVSSYYVTAADTDTIEEAVEIIENRLYQAFSSDSAYRVTSMSAMIDTVNEMIGSVSTVLVGIAGISLLVGGIGIMNIMLVSVTERTREIGIRKSLGAKRKAIMGQFIIEAATTSSIGGILGILLGIAGAYGAGKLMDMSATPTLNAILLAFSVSVGIGIVFGYFPASKASKKNPIDALRHD